MMDSLGVEGLHSYNGLCVGLSGHMTLLTLLVISSRACKTSSSLCSIDATSQLAGVVKKWMLGIWRLRIL